MECKDDRIDGVPDTFNGLTSKFDLSKYFGKGLREQIDQSRTDINPVITGEEILKQSEKLFKAIEELAKEKEEKLK